MYTVELLSFVKCLCVFFFLNKLLLLLLFSVKFMPRLILI